MARDRLKRFFRREHSDNEDPRKLLFRQRNHPVEDPLVDHYPPTSVTKPDLWQRAFDELEPEDQQLIQSILIPESNTSIHSSDLNADPGVVNRLKALNWVVETVKTQYEIDQQKSKIKEPTQKVIKAVLSFQDLIKAAVALDPTGHANKVWAIVCLGLTMTQNYRSQKVAWLESSAYIADILTRYSFVEEEYQKDPNTNQHVETALVQVYIAVLTFAAQVQSLYDRSHAILIWKSISRDTLSDLQLSIDQAESQLGQWLRIVDRREQRERGMQLLEKVDRMLTDIENVVESLDELNGKMVLAELKIAEEAHYNANTGEEYQECLQETRIELLKDIRDWATDLEKRPVFWLQGMAGTGKSTVSRTVARSLDNEGLLGGSFFFKKGGTDREDGKRLFSTLTKQILERLPHLQAPVKRAIKETRGIGSNNPQEQFNELLLKPLQDLDLGLQSPLILVVVIDALDECQVPADVASFFSTLPKLSDLTHIRLRFFITSRPEPTVMKGFQHISKDEIVLHQIDRSIIEHDIAIFLRERLGRIRTDHGLMEEWPGEETIAALVDMAAPLFIYAATIYRFIGCEGESPDDRLQAILASHLSDGMEKVDDEYSKLTGIYLPVLKHIVSQKASKELRFWMDDFRRIMGAIILLFSPLSLASLASLLCSEQIKVQGRLSTLQSLVSVPKDSETPIQLLHLSFREFLVDRSASDEFWIDELVVHTQLAQDCLKCMNQGLKRNIGRLLSPGSRRNEIKKMTLEGYVSPELRYACRYWIRHLANGDQMSVKWELIEDFFKVHFLHWLELMSLLGWVSETIGNINTLQSLAKSNQLSGFLEDAKRFILKNRQIADEAPLQIYCAGLIFAPQKSIIRKEFKEEFPTWIFQLPKTEENWSAELQTLEGHSRGVNSVTFSPNGRLLASCSDDRTIRLWDSETGDLQQTLKGHSNGVNSVAFSPDGQLLASGSDDRTIRLWDLTGNLKQTLKGHCNGVNSVAFSPDGQILVSGSRDKTIQLWDLATGNFHIQQTLKGHLSGVYLVTFSPDGRLLASASWDKTIRLWDLAGNLKQTLKGHSNGVYSVAFSPDGQLLASGSWDKTIRLWDLAGNLKQTLKGHCNGVNSVTFSPDGRLLVSGSQDKTIQLWDLVTGNLQQTLKGHSNGVNLVAFSPDGRLLVSGSRDKTVQLWDPAIKDLQQAIEGHSSRVYSVAFSSNSQLLLASGSDDMTIQLWDPATGSLQKTLKGHSDWVKSVAFSPNNQLLASGSDDKTICLWDPVTGELQQTLKGHSNGVNSVTFSPDSQLLASGSEDKTVRVWDLTTGDLQQTLKGHSGWVKSVAFSPDGQLLASSSEDKTVRFWDLSTGDLQQTLDTHATVCDLKFSRDGSYIVTNLGTLNVKPGHDNKGSHSTHTRLPIVIKQEKWINLDHKDVLWLPPHFRPFCSTVNMDLLALGHKSGRVSFLRFSL